VLKVGTGTSPTIISSNIITKTGPYRMAFITGKDDDSLGQQISSSSSNPWTNFYGSIALDLSRAPASLVLSNLHFSYLNNAFSATNVTMRDVQFVQCKNGLAAGSRTVTVLNGLAYKVNSMVDSSGTTITFTGENLTAHFCTNFLANLSGTVNLTNCLFACVTNWQCATANLSNNAMTNNDSGIFVTVGAGGHYLPTNSPYLGIGSVTIDSGLLSELRQKTVAQPFVYDAQQINYSLVLSPRTQRDTATSPALGFHFDPLDYVFRSTTLSNCSVQVAPGTVIGTAALFTNNGYGLGLLAGVQFYCQGTPTSPNWIVRYNMSQEHCNTNWDPIGNSLLGDWLGGQPAAYTFFRFTDWSVPAQDGSHYQDWNQPHQTIFMDC
jgi:hypothetical protein